MFFKAGPNGIYAQIITDGIGYIYIKYACTTNYVSLRSHLFEANDCNKTYKQFISFYINKYLNLNKNRVQQLIMLLYFSFHDLRADDIHTVYSKPSGNGSKRLKTIQPHTNAKRFILFNTMPSTVFTRVITQKQYRLWWFIYFRVWVLVLTTGCIGLRAFVSPLDMCTKHGVCTGKWNLSDFWSLTKGDITGKNLESPWSWVLGEIRYGLVKWLQGSSFKGFYE